MKIFLCVLISDAKTITAQNKNSQRPPDLNFTIWTAIENFKTFKSLLLLGGFFGFSRGFFLLALSRRSTGLSSCLSAFFSSLRFFNNLDYLDGNSGDDDTRVVDDVHVFNRGQVFNTNQ